MNKSLGYIIAALGILALATTFEPVMKMLGIVLPNTVSKTLIIIVGLVFVMLGVLFMAKSPAAKQPEEVPIYQGKTIVGYRRVSN